MFLKSSYGSLFRRLGRVSLLKPLLSLISNVSLYLKSFFKVLMCASQGQKGATAAERTVIGLYLRSPEPVVRSSLSFLFVPLPYNGTVRSASFTALASRGRYTGDLQVLRCDSLCHRCCSEPQTNKVKT